MNFLFSTKLNLHLRGQALLIIAFVFCVNAFSHAQSSTLAPCEIDTLTVLNGQVQLFLKKGVYRKSKPKTVASQFAILCPRKLRASDGFEIGEDAKLYFYQTDIDFPENTDHGLAIWKLIEPIVGKISEGLWAESGWRYLNRNSYLYFVKVLTDTKSYQFGFFNTEGKLSFSFQFQNLGANSDESFVSAGNNLQLTKKNIRSPRFVSKR